LLAVAPALEVAVLLVAWFLFLLHFQGILEQPLLLQECFKEYLPHPASPQLKMKRTTLLATRYSLETWVKTS
jgi:hypothetical protein